MELYNQNQVPVDEAIINQLFGDDINFTLERFINITQNKEELKRYFKCFRKIKKLMLIRSDGNRSYMPTTFDETMVEFGYKLERKRVLDELKE